MQVVSFRIPYTDPFGNRVYHNGAAATPDNHRKGSMVSIRESRSGITSHYLGEVTEVHHAAKEEYGFTIVKDTF